MRWIGLAGALAATAAQAQQVPAPPPADAPAAQEAGEDETPIDADEAPDIVVTGSRRLPGAVVGDIPPEEQLGPAEIRSYGVNSVNDLLTELAPQTRSGVGGAPVVLLNGRRIAGFQEIRDLPTEAIQRVDILPEEVALKYGYRADQKVVNIVLRRRFRAVTAEAADRAATEGGRNAAQGEVDLLRIQRDRRLNVHLSYQDASRLTEAERGIIPPPGSTTDPTAYRTLLPATQTASANLVYARNIFDRVGATFNARVERTTNQSLLGPALAGDASVVTLGRGSRATTAHLGTTFNGDAGRWRWTSTLAYDRTDSRTLNDASANGTLLPDRSRASSNARSAELQSLATGPLFALPAGDVSTTLRIGASTSDFSSRSLRLGIAQSGDVSRDIGNGQLNLDVPIASKSKGVLGAIGTLSLNGNVGADQLSDFGTLTSIGYGANWSPLEGVRIITSVTDRDTAPSPQQLGNPTIVTPQVRVFDYVAGTTVDVTTITGGTRNLVAEDRHVTRFGLNLKPWKTQDLVLTASYVSTRVDDPLAAFPSATAAIEAAFPDRFTRDAAGNLARIDLRPINFARSESTQLRWGITFSKPLKSRVQRELEAFRAGAGPNPFAGMQMPGRRGGDARLRDQAAPESGTQRQGAGSGDGQDARGRRSFGGGRFGGRGGGGGRLQFALYHTWHFKDEVVVRDGLPRLDLLRGDAIGGSGGQPRHEIEAQAGYTNNGLGARASANWQSGTRVNGGTPDAPETLRFSGLATFNLRLFGNLGQRLDLVKAHPWFRGTRVTLSVDNIFNQRQRVTDALGTTPISYQPDYLDPLGRTVRLSLRKLFF